MAEWRETHGVCHVMAGGVAIDVIDYDKWGWCLSMAICDSRVQRHPLKAATADDAKREALRLTVEALEKMVEAVKAVQT